MARSGWPDLPWRGSLPGLWSRPERRRGLVLAGGGSRASFELGALAYLYDETDFHPEVITGTSAGSILATALAQYADREDQRRVVATLTTLWRGLQEPDDMFAPRDWFRRLQSLVPQLSAALEPQARVEDDEEADAEPPRRGWWSWTERRATRAEVAAEAAKDPGEDQHYHPLLGFGPESDELGQADGWTPQVVSQALGLVQALGRAGGEIPSIVHGAERSRATHRPGPLLRRLLDPDVFSPQRLAGSGVECRIAVVCLETGQLRYVRGDAVILDRHGVPLPGVEPVDMVLAVLASCSIPSVFAPVPLAGQHYVDGGVRENLPVEACRSQLGADRPVTIVCSPPGVSSDEAWARANLFAIMGRATAIMSDETLRDEVAYARAAGCPVIEPEVDVHGAMDVDPGLIDINIAYGWMRAMETMTEAGDEVVRLHRDLTIARQRAWDLENALYSPAAGPDALRQGEHLAELVEQKYRIRDLVASAPAATFPPGAQRWWTQWEEHPWTVPTAAPWLVGLPSADA